MKFPILSNKVVWIILPSITVILWLVTVLVFIDFIPFEYQFIPIFYASLFFIFYLILNQYFLGPDGIVLTITTILIGFLYEKFASHFNLFTYQHHLISIQEIPIAVLLTWTAVLSQVYHFTNGFCVKLGLSKPSKSLKTLIFFLLFDGILLSSLGLLLDFALVQSNFWVWQVGFSTSTFYEGFIVMNYFSIAILSSGVFRVYEFFNPSAQPIHPLPSYITFSDVYTVCLIIGVIFLMQDFQPLYLFPISFIALLIIKYRQFYKSMKK